MSNKKKKTFAKRETNIGELINAYPKAAEIMTAYGLHCAGCFASNFDTIEEGAKIHGITDDEIDEMVEEINMVLNEEENSDKKNNSKSTLEIGKIEIDRDVCIGAGPCEVLAPKTFQVDEKGKAVLLLDGADKNEAKHVWKSSSKPTGEDSAEDILDAAMSCPVFAIKIYDKDGNLIYPK